MSSGLGAVRSRLTGGSGSVSTVSRAAPAIVQAEAVHVVRDHVHTQGRRLDGHLLADQAQPDHTEGGSGDLVAAGLVPAAGGNRVRALRDATHDRHHQTQGQFGDGLAVGPDRGQTATPRAVQAATSMLL